MLVDFPSPPTTSIVSDDGSSSICSLSSAETTKKRKSCSLSALVDSDVGPAFVPMKRKRRKRAVTPEERERRALERKKKNRESAMRSRQRVLHEMQKNKEEVTRLREENRQQRDEIARLKAELQDAKQKLSGPVCDVKSEEDVLTSQELFDLIPQRSFSGDFGYDEMACFEFIFFQQSKTSNISTKHLGYKADYLGLLYKYFNSDNSSSKHFLFTTGET